MAKPALVVPEKVELNDIHSRLNSSSHFTVVYPKSIVELREIIKDAKDNGRKISISGGRHSMGGQQFGNDSVNINLDFFSNVITFDAQNGLVEVESGIQWPKLVEWLASSQRNSNVRWGIRQKQTGADNLSIGGSLSSNIHGRGLNMKPFIDDIESFGLINADSDILECSREKNTEMFRLVIGGYGLFGVIATVKIRLAKIQILERIVELTDINNFSRELTEKIDDGCLYGDFQFSIDSASDSFLRSGVSSFYKPIAGHSDGPDTHNELSENDWKSLIYLAHTDKGKAFAKYSEFYLSTNGQRYQSDVHQMGVYIKDYHEQLNFLCKASEMIGEIFVPKDKLVMLFDELRSDLRALNVDVIYGTVRFIKKDKESFLAWAKEDYVTIVFNFHIEHTTEGIRKATAAFRHIIDCALNLGGSYFLTYHKWARKDQVLRAYPQFVEFLKFKVKYDASELFLSDWYVHYKKMFRFELEEKSRDVPSATAALILKTVLFAKQDDETSQLISSSAYENSMAIAAKALPNLKLFLAFIRNPLGAGTVKLVEKVLNKGFIKHIAARKALIRKLSIEAIDSGVQQVVIIGSGYDSLGVELASAYSGIPVFEVDRLATLSAKKSLLAFPNLVHVPIDLGTSSFGQAISEIQVFDFKRKTLIIIEGVLMYMPEGSVDNLFSDFKKMFTEIQCIFTFMDKRKNGDIQFATAHSIINFWLRFKNEQFLWGIDKEKVSTFLKSHEFQLLNIYDHNYLAEQFYKGIQAPSLAIGESICMADFKAKQVY